MPNEVIKKYIGRCRRGYTDLIIPCNWVKDGYCGADTQPCYIEVTGTKNFKVFVNE